MTENRYRTSSRSGDYFGINYILDTKKGKRFTDNEAIVIILNRLEKILRILKEDKNE